MSRNTEKAQSMLYRFHEQQAAEMGIVDVGRSRRPRKVTDVDSVPMCEKWRSQVMKEISRKLVKIQDTALNDFQIRDLNDQINKLIQEKRAWEHRLKELGGPNYLRLGAVKPTEDRGVHLPDSKGYRYFGRAKELPGVQEVLEAEAQRKQRAQEDKTDAQQFEELANRLGPSYYGFVPVDSETVAEEGAHERPLPAPSDHGPEFVPLGDINVPTLEEVEQMLVERKRQQLEQKYGISMDTN